MPISLSPATIANQEADVRSILFSLKFDWQNDNFVTGPTFYDAWFQCYEIIDNGGTDEYIGIENLRGNLVINPQYEDTALFEYDESNSGNGQINTTGEYKISYLTPGEGENFTVVCVDNETVDSETYFVVKGETVGILDDAVLNDPYGFEDEDNGYIQFKIDSGTSQYAIGDIIRIYPAITTRDYDQEATLTNIDENDKVGFLVEGGPDFINWEKIEWLSEGDVRVLVRTCTNIDDPVWGDWVEYTNGDNIGSEQARRYLHFKVIFNSTTTQKAKLSWIKFNYDVKAHTNNTKSFNYESGFNDVESIRISRSKEFIQAGYGAADCDISMSNTHRRYNRENSVSPYYGKLEPDLKCIVQLGFDEQTVTKIEMYADSFSIDPSKKTFTIRGKDITKAFLNKQITDEDISSRVWVDKPIQFLIRMLCLDTGFSLDRLRLEDTTINPNIPYAFFKGKQVWKELQTLVEAYEGEIYVSEDGYLVLRDRFRKRNLFKSPRYSDKNTVCAIAINESNGSNFLVIHSEEFNESFLYMYYNDKYVLIDTNYRALEYVAEDQEDGYSSVYGLKSNKMLRFAGNSEIPLIEEIMDIGDQEFSNVFLFHNHLISGLKYCYGILKDRDGLYKYYKYGLLDSSNEFQSQSGGSSFTDPLALWELGVTGYYEADLTHFAYDLQTSRMTYIDAFDNNEYGLVYGTDWEFTDDTLSRVRILKDFDNINRSYFAKYLLLQPTTIIDTVGFEYIRNTDKFDLNMENYSEIFFSRLIIVDNTSTDNHKDSIESPTYNDVYLINFNDSDQLVLHNYITGDTYIYTDSVEKCYGAVCDSFVGKIYIFILDSNNNKKILAFDLFDTANGIVDTEDNILIDGVNDPNLNIYDVEFNEEDDYTYIACGYASNINNDAILLRYRESYVDVNFTNVVGKPLDKVLVRKPDDTDSVIEKDYDMFFQKRGGIGATTSQIWTWYAFTRRNEDKIKSAIKETLIDAEPTNTDAFTRLADRFQIPVTEDDLTFKNIEYVYKSDPREGYINIGNQWYKDLVSEEVVLTSPINVDITNIRFGSGKILKKYFGEYLNIDGVSIPNWEYLNFASFPYKPTKLRFRGDNLQDGYILVSGYDIAGDLITENLFYSTVSGYVDGDLTYDKQYRGTVRINASGVYVDPDSELICESTYEDLIPGIDLYVYVDSDETEDQFGGNGLVTGFTNEASVNVDIKDGLEFVTRFTTEKAITCLTTTSNGILYGGTSYIGQYFVYSKSQEITDVVDFVLSYDTNIQSSNYSWGRENIKNSVKVTAKKLEAVPLREFEILTGIPISEIPQSSHIRDWVDLEILYRTQSPRFLYPGEYLENNVQFSDPVLSRVNNQIKFDAHVSEFMGYVKYDGNMGYIDDAASDHRNAITDELNPDYYYLRYKLNGNFINISGGIEPFQDPFNGNIYNINVSEAEKRNCDVYIGSRQLSYLSGDFDIIMSSGDYILQIDSWDFNNDIPYSGIYRDGGLTFHYPQRWNVSQNILERSIEEKNTTGLSGDFLWSIIYDTHYDGVADIENGNNNLKYYYIDGGGFQLNVLWPNRSTYAETSYLRIENPAIDSLDAYYDPESNPSGWSVWIDKVELRGRPITSAPVTLAIERDLESIKKYGEQTLTIENPYIQEADIAQGMARYALQHRSMPVIDLNQKIMGMASMQLGDLVAVDEHNSSIDGDIFEVVNISDNLSVGAAYVTDIKLEKLEDKKTGTGIYDLNEFDNEYRYG